MKRCRVTKFIIFGHLMLTCYPAIAKFIAPDLPELPISSKTLQRILNKHYIYSNCTVDSFKDSSGKNKQKLKFNIIGLHPNSCKRSLKILGQYEQFSQFLSFVKTSSYSEKTQEIDLGVQHGLFPIPLRVKFKLPRIKKIGRYPYHFPNGFLPDLRGHINVIDYRNSCLYWTDAHWEGADTGFPDTILGIFTQTVSRIGMEKLFRVSKL
jgi:hypothetical protein